MPVKLIGDQVVSLTLSPAKLNWLWTKLSGRPSEFSEFVAPDPAAFEEALLSQALLWYEFPAEDEKSGGLIALSHADGETDATIRVIMVDKRPGEKVEAFRKWLKFAFANFPVNHISIEIPDLHFALKRLVGRTGFRREGTKRDATRMGGRWVNVGIHGILRSEVV